MTSANAKAVDITRNQNEEKKGYVQIELAELVFQNREEQDNHEQDE